MTREAVSCQNTLPTSSVALQAAELQRDTHKRTEVPSLYAEQFSASKLRALAAATSRMCDMEVCINSSTKSWGDSRRYSTCNAIMSMQLESDQLLQGLHARHSGTMVSEADQLGIHKCEVLLKEDRLSRAKRYAMTAMLSSHEQTQHLEGLATNVGKTVAARLLSSRQQ